VTPKALLTRLFSVCFAGAILFALVVFVRAGSSSPPSKTMPLTVGWSGLALSIANDDVPAGTAVTIYLNGRPPDGYIYQGTLPAPGNTLRIPLSSFLLKDGTRFNPITHAVTRVWIGGDGYDFVAYGK
jgi:hypothetical protein